MTGISTNSFPKRTQLLNLGPLSRRVYFVNCVLALDQVCDARWIGHSVRRDTLVPIAPYTINQLNAGRRNTEGIAGKNSTVARAQPPLKRVRESCWEAAADSDFPPLKRVRIGGTTASVAGTRQFFPILPAPECQPLDIPKPAWTAPSRGPSSMKLHMRMLLSQIRLIDLPTLHQSNFWKDLEVRSKAAIPRVKVQDLLHASFAEGTKFIPGKELRGFTFSVATSARVQEDGMY